MKDVQRQHEDNMRFLARHLAGWLLLAPALALATPTDSPEVEKSIKPEMVRIKAGCFQMGSPATEPGREDNERQHEVCIQSDYEIGKYEVTQGQWKAVMGNDPARSLKEGDNYPVDSVSWNDAHDYLTKLNQKTGKQYRLPTEAEWECAARAGTTTG